MSRSRWIKRALAAVLGALAAGGCKQQLFMEPGDYNDALKIGMPKQLETNPHAPVVPGDAQRLNDINTVTDFVRPPRHMTLRECVAIALEQGNVGVQSPTNVGFKNEFVAQASGGRLFGTDAIRAFAVDPAIASVAIERSLSRFDVRWVTQMQWDKLDQPVAAQFLSFQQSRDVASLNSSLVKPLPTGGMIGITVSTDYSKFSQQAAVQTQLVNPNYTPRVQIGIEQPLLRMFGVEINQIAGTHPYNEGNQLPSVFRGLRSAGGLGTEGILITRIRADQSKADFEAKVNYMLVNVEAAYWNLYAAYYNLYAQEEGLRQAFEGYRFTLIRVQAGTDPPQRLDQVQAQFERFRRQVYQARGQVLESERQLRGLLGLRSDDGTRIVPIDEPNMAPYKPDFQEAANDAIALRPELILARQDVKAQQLSLMLNKNLRRPDLRGYASYDVAALGTRLGGSAEDFGPGGVISPGNAFAGLVDNRFNSWTLGLRLDVPLGFRDANGLVRQSQLDLARSYVQLRDAELKVIEYLSLQYRRVIQTYAEIAPARAEREALQRYLWRVREVIRGGGWRPEEFLNYLTVQQQLAGAIATEQRAVADYNIALAQFEFAKGTVQQYNNVSIGDGPLPPWVQKRATDHFRERTEAAFKLREQPVPPGGVLGGQPIGPAGGVPTLLAIPPFAEDRGPLPDGLPRPVDPMKQPDPPGAPMGGGKPDVFPALPGGNPGLVRPWPATPTGRTPAQPLPQPLPTGVGSTPGAGQPPSELGPGAFTPDGRTTLPPYPPGAGRTNPTPASAPSGTPVGTGQPAPPEGYFSPDGKVTLPPYPKRGEPEWGPANGTPVTAPPPTPLTPPTGAVPPPPALSVPAPPPIPHPGIPATLPPIPPGP